MIKKFDRGKSDAIFIETLDWLDVLNSRDGKFDYSDYVTLLNDFTALYDSFSHVDEVIDGLRQQLAEANRRADAAIKEMKLIVDAVREEHCDDTCCFACMFDCDTGITWTGDHANECPGFELNDCFLWRGAEKGAET